ncbi:MAG: molybdopterin molybdotransferase MoeA [Pseudomonadota bacterium]
MKGALLSVEAALHRLLSLTAPLQAETAPLMEAVGRVLREPLAATHTQPPFDASQMDGYAVALSQGSRSEEAVATAGLAAAGTTFTLRGSSRAGSGAPSELTLRPGEAIRIFTGAPLPPAAPGAALTVALQEDATVAEADGTAPRVSFREALRPGRWIRPRGLDFQAGDVLLAAPRRLSAEDVTLAAAAGAPSLMVTRRPRVALLALGDELREPGAPLGPDQIYASGQYGVAALLAQAGADIRLPPIVPDALDALIAALRAASDVDLLVTLGGASAGDHDLARPAFEALGVTPEFHRIAMRPGKPLMAGRLGETIAVGLPGNPVSALVCARVFLLPTLAAMEGAPPAAHAVGGGAWLSARLATDLGPGGPRAHYMRAVFEAAADGGADRRVRPFEDQDSSRQALLSAADCLVLRPAGDPPRPAGAPIDCLPLR